MSKKNKKPEFVPKTDNQPQDRHITIDYFHLYENLLRKEIDDWINARTARRDPFRPITYYQQQLYKDALLDNHLAGAIDTQRILPIVNKLSLSDNSMRKNYNRLCIKCQHELYAPQTFAGRRRPVSGPRQSG